MLTGGARCSVLSLQPVDVEHGSLTSIRPHRIIITKIKKTIVNYMFVLDKHCLVYITFYFIFYTIANAKVEIS